jgi:polyisoprenoid-binding protein YceI
MFLRRAVVAIALVATATATSAETTQYLIATGQPSRVTFESKAPAETFTGETDQVSGTIELDPAAIADVITLQVEVDLASFSTGIGLRDKHMREQHLHTEQFPRAVFTGGKVSELSARELTPEKPVTGTLEGELTLHGVTKPITARFELALDGTVLHAVAQFGVTLADFEIPRPKFLMLKLGETQAVTVALVARPQ